MVNKQKGLLGVVAATLVVAMTACGSGNNENKVASPSAATETAKASAGASASPSAATEPVPLRIFTSDFSQPVPGGATMDNPTLKYLAEKTNTKLDVVFFPHTQMDGQLSTKYAAGDIPDVVMGWNAGGELYNNNQLLELNDYIDKYGPNLKKVIPQAAWDAVTIDGKIMGIPEPAGGNVTENSIIYVRKDWMDKVGITEAPKTPDELLTLLRAFRDKDPNGNGQKDEIPFSSRENMTWVNNLFGMYGQNHTTAKYENNELLPGFITSNHKEGLAFMRTMYEEKLIDSEFTTNKRNVWEQKIQQGIVGMWNHDPALAWDWQDRLNKSLPNEHPDVIAIPTPKAPGVTDVGSLRTSTNKVYLITKKVKDPAAAVKFFDWLASEEGQEFVNFGIPGDTYTKDGGKIVYDQQKDVDAKTSTWRSIVFNIVGYNEELLKTKLGNDEAFEKQKLAYEVARNESIPNLMTGMPAIKTNSPEVPGFGYTGMPLYLETATQIILGEKPLDYFDEFVKEYKSLGGADAIKQASDWYNATKK
ncbi:extracellular solute-binding protein [Cohnella sp. GCM10020058]|uniref:extracellular solute-binding protein n=1 Tax=Cohnella sp. GCM10020058 TaxID=3317330 RepID=UPI00363249CB